MYRLLDRLALKRERSTKAIYAARGRALRSPPLTPAGTGSTVGLTGGSPRLAFEEAGTGDVVLFLHGVGGNRRNWRAQLVTFSHYFRAIAWDARGYGDSDDYDGSVGIADFADDVVRLLDYLSVHAAHLVGLSMGGNVAMQCAVRHPERVRSLVLCDTDRGMTHIPQVERLEFLRMRRDPLLYGREVADIAPALIDSLASPYASAEARTALLESLLLLRKEMYIKSVEATVQFDITQSVQQISCPTLVLVGEFDRLTPPSESKAICDKIAGSELVVIPRAGHLSNLEQPQTFDSEVQRFLLALPRVSVI